MAKTRKTAPKPRPKKRKAKPAQSKHDVTLELFALKYLANDRNGTDAYMETHPKAKRTTARTEGARLLTDPRVQRILHREIQARKERLQMDADEALAGISNIARADIRRLYDEAGNILPVKLWPEDLMPVVKELAPTPFGWKLKLYDRLKAFELMAIAGGKLRQQVDHKHTFDHARYLMDVPPPGDEDAPKEG